VPPSGYYVPVSASGVIRVTLVGVGPTNFGTVVVSDQVLPAGVALRVTDTKSLEVTQTPSNLLGVYIGVPISLVLILVIIAILLKLRK